MAESNKLVAAIKVGGKILRETLNVVSLPFSSEYGIFLKNLNSLRVVVNISIDGVNVTDGGVIIEPNTSLDLERSIHKGNLDKGNKFKFIERTSQIEEYRGIGAEDGIVRVEYKFEIPQPIFFPYTWLRSCSSAPTSNPNTIRTVGIDDFNIVYTTTSNDVDSVSNTSYIPSTIKGCNAGDTNYYSYVFPVDSIQEAAFNDAGITVAGSESNQRFVQVPDIPTEQVSHVLIFKLVGKVHGQKAKNPITVQTRLTCTTCGKVNKVTNNFCGRCGTALILL